MPTGRRHRSLSLKRSYADKAGLVRSSLTPRRGSEERWETKSFKFGKSTNDAKDVVRSASPERWSSAEVGLVGRSTTRMGLDDLGSGFPEGSIVFEKDVDSRDGSHISVGDGAMEETVHVGKKSNILGRNKPRHFANLIHIMNNRYVFYAVLFMLTFSTLLPFTIYLLEEAREEDAVPEPPSLFNVVFNIFCFVATGPLNIFALILGNGLYLRNEIHYFLMMDVCFWAAVLIGFGFQANRVRSEEPATSRNIFFLSLGVSFGVVRLVLFNIITNEISTIFSIKHKLQEQIGVNPQRVADVINDSNMPTLYKREFLTQLEKMVATARTQKIITEYDFLALKGRFARTIWRLKRNKKSIYEEAMDDLLEEMSFVGLLGEVLDESDDYESSSSSPFRLDPEELEGKDETVVSTVITGFQQLVKGQYPLFMFTTLVISLSVVAMHCFGLVAGKLLTIASEMAATNDDDSSKENEFWTYMGLLVCCYLANEGFYYVTSYCGAKLVSNSTARIQYDLAQAVLFGSEQFSAKYRPGTLANVFSAGLAKAEQVWDYIIFDLLVPVISILAALTFLSLVNQGYAVFVMAAVPALFCFQFIEKKATENSAAADDTRAALLGRFQNLIRLRHPAVIFKSQMFLLDLFKVQLKAAKDDSFLEWMWSNYLEAVFSSVGYTLNLVTHMAFFVALSNGRITPGEFFSLISFVNGVIEPLESLGTFSGQVALMSGPVHKVQRILDGGAVPNIPEDEDNPSIRISLEKEIKFDHVTFKYPGASSPVLSDISFSVKAGTYVCLCGPSGSGKSTILSLLTGFQKVETGIIQFDGEDSSKASIENLRSLLAVVFQDTFVLDGTIADNIAFGYQNGGQTNEKTNDGKPARMGLDSIAEAAKKAQIHDFIEGLDSGYDTEIGKEGSTDLSVVNCSEYVV